MKIVRKYIRNLYTEKVYHKERSLVYVLGRDIDELLERSNVFIREK